MLMVIDDKGQRARPWLTVVLEDSRCGARVMGALEGTPSGVRLSLAWKTWTIERKYATSSSRAAPR